jgi:hypothetical protein
VSSLAKRFHELFAGLERGHGRYDISANSREGDKTQGRASFVKSPVTEDLWEDHLAGKVGIGIVPIRDDATCVWGVIDVDRYNLDLPALSKVLTDTPLLLCRSKSGGAHIFCFASEPVPAHVMQERLARAAAALGYGGVEVFPKQVELKADRGDMGNWLNMPYFGGENSTRYAIINGESVTPEEFIEAAHARRLTRDDLGKLTLVDESDGEKAIPDGPPCLQLMCRNGISSGGRNNALYNIGVYLKLAYPDEWRSRLEDYNRGYVQPPLDAGEVLALIKSLDKKQYHYTCDREPLASHCDKRACVKRKFGVRGGAGDGQEPDMPIIGGLTKLETSPPIWFLDVEGFRMGPLATEDLQLQPRFQKTCMEQINRMPPQLKPQRWNELINGLLATAQIVEMPDDSSDESQTWYHLEKFCIGRAQCDSVDELIVSDKPWTDDVNGLTYFKLVDFIAFLERRRFKSLTPQQLAGLLRERGAKAERQKIKGKDVSLWIVPRFVVSAVDLATPSFDEHDF